MPRTLLEPHPHPVPAHRRRLRLLAGALALVGLTSVQALPADATPRGSVSVRLIAFNDFHGNLEPPEGSSGRVVVGPGATPDAPAVSVEAGGAAYLATHIAQLRAAASHSLVLSAGDSIGASPLASALFHDEPTIAVLNQIGVSASVVGNHEFDEGYAELLRIQTGGCHPDDGCQFTPKYGGARFPFLGANVTRTDGFPALLPFTVKFSGGVPIGIIGVTLEELPTVVTAEAVDGLTFGDEVRAIDRTANLLDRLGVKAQVVLMHQGDDVQRDNTPDACNLAPDGAASEIAREASPKVDVIFTAHSHQQYNCSIDDPDGRPRTVIQGASFGRLLSVVDLRINRRTKDVRRSATVAHNEIVTRTVTPDPAVAKIIADAVAKSKPIANRQVGTITADLLRSGPTSGETPLGDAIADAQLAATQDAGAQIAITNPGGVRADLLYASGKAAEGDGVVTYGEAFTVQPFANIMQTITLTGAQLDAVLEQQWQPTTTRILQISASLHYSWSRSAAAGAKVSDITVNGTPVDPAATYRVSVNNFLAGGGDGFTVFTEGTDLAGGPIDLDAFTAYLAAHPNLAPPASDRITVVP